MRSNNWFPRVGIRFTVGLIILIITTLISRTALQLKSTESMPSLEFLFFSHMVSVVAFRLFAMESFHVHTENYGNYQHFVLGIGILAVVSSCVAGYFLGQLEMHIFYDFSLVVLITDLHYVIRQKAFLSCAQYKREGPTTFIDWTA